MMFKDGIGRKFFVCLSLLVAHYVALLLSVIDAATYQAMLWVVLGAMIGGNLGERVISKTGTPK